LVEYEVDVWLFLVSFVFSVCQCFAVLEDGALAHSLQEQEIEQYYTTNIQKNQLVQNDIRVAKRLQDEEEEQWVNTPPPHTQTHEQDFEYARLIQEEILRGAKEAQRREQDDEEIAKRLHEEEKQRFRRISRGEESPTGLDLGELQQVLQDEELARKLQEHEEKLLRRTSQSSPCSTYPEGDFKVAQVAQDEEIAHFMQKQEIRSKRRSRELEGPSSWREHRVQRERLDSEGLPSPTDDCSPENQPTQHIRNIAEELDPTFQARGQGTEILGVGLTEPTFIPPTKRQTDKPGRSKPKGKKENCKQQ
uniref:Coiled-coil domain-containing protein n=1 Tax=Mola mola TaxID=94237 RepID=A0A3Q3W6V4_MOLML